jgi:hypothetical protein
MRLTPNDSVPIDVQWYIVIPTFEVGSKLINHHMYLNQGWFAKCNTFIL